jgi:hypothetical protein
MTMYTIWPALNAALLFQLMKLGLESGRKLQFLASPVAKVNWYWKLLGQLMREKETTQQPENGLELNSLEHHLLVVPEKLVEAQEVQEGAELQV